MHYFLSKVKKKCIVASTEGYAIEKHPGANGKCILKRSLKAISQTIKTNGICLS